MLGNQQISETTDKRKNQAFSSVFIIWTASQDNHLAGEGKFLFMEVLHPINEK